VRRRSDTAFVDAAYRGILGRAPDGQGLGHQLAALAGGLTRSELLGELVESSETARHVLYSPGVQVLVEEFWRSRHQAGPEVRPLYFLHIMKTAGTALTNALQQMASDVEWTRLTDVLVDHLVCLPPPLLHQALLIAGHLPYEAVGMLPSGGAVCTVLRDPVQRTLSHHAHLNATIGSNLIALTEFVRSDTWRPLWVNYQTRQLVHEIGLAQAWKGFSPVEQGSGRTLSGADRRFPLQSLFDTGPLEGTERELIAAGIARLETIDLVGTTNALPALLGRVAEMWNRPPPSQVPRLRVTTARMRPEDVPISILADIRAGTAVDAVLYEHAADVRA